MMNATGNWRSRGLAVLVWSVWILSAPEGGAQEANDAARAAQVVERGPHHASAEGILPSLTAARQRSPTMLSSYP